MHFLGCTINFITYVFSVVTVMVATGDDGASSFLTRNNPKFCGYHPDFPSASPYVTAVGATMVCSSIILLRIVVIIGMTGT